MPESKEEAIKRAKDIGWEPPSDGIIESDKYRGKYYVLPSGITNPKAKRAFMGCRDGGGESSTCAAVSHNVQKTERRRRKENCAEEITYSDIEEYGLHNENMQVSVTVCADISSNITEQADPRKFPVKVRIMRDGRTRNTNMDGYTWTFKDMEKFAKTFEGMPILVNVQNGVIGDYASHDGARERDWTGANTERIVGLITEVWTENSNDGVWAIGKGHIFCYYYPQVCERIKATGLEVSSETDILSERINQADKTLEFYVYRGIGVTMLGSKTKPAIPGSNIVAASFDDEDLPTIQEEWSKLIAASLKEPDDDELPIFDDMDDEPEDDEKYCEHCEQRIAECKCRSKDDDDKRRKKNHAVNGKDQDGILNINTNKNKEKSERSITMNFNQFVKKWQPLFPNHVILALSEKGNSVMLLDKETYAYCEYEINADDGNDINAKRFKTMNAAVTATFSDGEIATFALDNVLEYAGGFIASANQRTDIEKADKDKEIALRQASEKKLMELEAQINSDRIAVCTDEVTKLHEINTNAKVPLSKQVSSETFNALLADISGGKYNAMFDADGKWIGKEACCAAYKALVGEIALMAMAKDDTTPWPNGIFNNDSPRGGSALDQFAASFGFK